MDLTQEFQDSYNGYADYPMNLVYKSSSLFALHAYKKRLDESGPKLCLSSEAKTDIRILDPPPSANQDFQEHTIVGNASLCALIGDTSRVDPHTNTIVGELATKPDPICRFIFFHAAHSRAKLWITRVMLVRVLSYFQVMQGYLNFLCVFGQQIQPQNTKVSGFRSDTLLTGSTQGREMPNLKRSGRQYQMCYNLKSVFCTSELSESVKSKQWSIRQIASCHQFDVETGTTLWLITQGSLEIKEHIQSLVGKNGRIQDRSFGNPVECFTVSLAVHLLLCDWACEGWRLYLQWLEDVVDMETKSAVIGPRGLDNYRREYKPEDLQKIQQFEEKTNEAIMVLEGNISVLTALKDYYHTLLSHPGFVLARRCGEPVATFVTQILDAIYDSKMHVARGKLLLRIVSDRKALVLQHLQTQQTENMEALTVLAQNEAVAMKIVTVVTLIYLPATFVSTFFSTDVVKYQGQNSLSGTSFSQIALLRWLQVTIPLTIVTLGGGWLWHRWAMSKQRKRLPFFKAIELEVL